MEYGEVVRGARYSVYGWQGVVPRCECLCPGCRWFPSARQSAASAARGWVWEDACVGVDGSVRAEGLGQEQERGEEGVVILQSPRPPCPRWLLIGFATAGLRLHSRAEPSAGELTPERCGGLGAGPRAPVSRGVPNPAPQRPSPALRQLRPAEDPQHQHGLLHRKLECLGDGQPAWSGARAPENPLEGEGGKWVQRPRS